LKKNPIYSIALAIVPTVVAFPQTLRQPLSAVYLNLSAYSTQHSDVFSFVNNQAALAQTKNAHIGFYSEDRFLLQQTTIYTTALALPTDKGDFGIDIRYAGFKNFNEDQIGLAYARNLGKKIDVGAQFNYYSCRIPSYNSASAVSIELGAIAHLTDQLNLGMHVYNPVGGNFYGTDEKLPSIFTVGMGYDASEVFYVSTEIVKEEDFPASINAGVQYRFQKRFFARAGIASATSSNYVGFGVAWNSFRMDISVSWHPQLGLSPGLLFIMDMDKKAK